MTDVHLFIYLYLNALPMIPLSQVKVSYEATYILLVPIETFIKLLLYDFQANFVSIWHLFVK